jgi:hypothetical protein
VSADPIAALREAGHTVDLAVPASDEAVAIYVASRGELGPVDDPLAPGGAVLVYVTEASAGDYTG